jgi:hypothetical protein
MIWLIVTVCLVVILFMTFDAEFGLECYEDE